MDIRFVFNGNQYKVVPTGEIYYRVWSYWQRSDFGSIYECRKGYPTDWSAVKFLEAYDAQVMAQIIKDRHPSEVF
jgi:hypothetical protein